MSYIMSSLFDFEILENKMKHNIVNKYVNIVKIELETRSFGGAVFSCRVLF